MTGFARADGASGTYAWLWELKSVNGRGLELRFRLPPGFESLEAPARLLAAERLKRGNINVAMQLTATPTAQGFQVNHALLDQLISVLRDLEHKVEAAPPRLDGLLSIRGVIEPIEPKDDEAARANREAAVLQSLANALDQLVKARQNEGARLGAVLHAQLEAMEELVKAAAAIAEARAVSARDRLEAGLKELLAARPPVSEERLAQELALLATKLDIREEIDRLRSHLASGRELLQKPDPAGIGRRLDFLSQEFNREANTLCSKSSDVELTRIGLDLKLVIDRFREQIQNIE